MQVTWLDQLSEAQRWVAKDHEFRVDDVAYISTMERRPNRELLAVRKPPALIDATVSLLRQFRRGNIVELGIGQGGSTALAAQVAEPRTLVAVELDTEPRPAFEAFLDEDDRRTRVRPYVGVDQADRARLREICDREFGEEPLDLVVDDASHRLDETRASFETLFPRLREGGLFVIEDWNWEHLRAKAMQEAVSNEGSAGRQAFAARLKKRLADPESDEYALFEEWMHALAETPESAQAPATRIRPLTILALELLVARAWSGDVVSELDVKEFWLVVRRGPASLDPETFRVSDITNDRFSLLP
jgi:predicted O-methyltransferase YrrM